MTAGFDAGDQPDTGAVDEERRQRLAAVIGGCNPRTGHVYIDGNDACLLIADALLAQPADAEAVGLRADVLALAKTGPRGFDMNPTLPIGGRDTTWWLDYLQRHDDFWKAALTRILADTEDRPGGGMGES